MKVIELLKSKEWSGKVIDCVLRFARSFARALAQVFGGYAPLALGMIGASGAGLRGVSALIGASAGAVLYLPFSQALRTLAAGVMIFTANNAYIALKLDKKRAFLPLLCAGMMFSVEFVYVLRDGVGEAANCLMALLLCALGAMSGRALLSTGDKEKEDHPYAPLFILLGVLMAASSFETADGFAPGRILSMLAVLLFAFERGSAFAIPAALCIGLGMDLGAGGGSFVHAASYAFSAVLVNVTARGNRVLSALWFALSILCFALPMNAHAGLVLLYEGLAATLLFLLIPSRFLRGKRHCSDEAAQEDAAVRRKIAASAAALRELYDSIARPRTLTEENPAAIFDRAAEKVCRGCALCSYCWEKEYQRTYTALNDATAALLAQGRGRGGDFPSYFTDRCIRFPSFLSAVNSELSAFLLRRQYRGRLADTRAQAAGQYAQLSELLSGAAETLEAQPTAAETLLTYRVGAALRPKEGENVSGDSVTHFETEDGRLCLLLSDGMGCGEEARRESALAVRLLERFLRAGGETSGARKTLNSALTLRAEVSESFTTIDLLTLSLRDGAAEVYKYGAAPSYVKRGARVRRLTGSCLPAGLQSADTRPETTGFSLEKGSFFVMLSDGVADVNDDGWLMALLEKFQGDDPQALASAILAAGRERRGGDDDCAVLALYRDKDGGAVEV